VLPPSVYAATQALPSPVLNNEAAISQHGQEGRSGAGADGINRSVTDVESFLDEFMKLLNELRTHVDRSQFELDALLSELDFDSENIINFIKQDIGFEQYPGLLRGAEGTLMSRAGNALDQSVLMAKLLKDAGYEARVAGTTLSEEQAKDLIDQMFIQGRAKPPPGDMQKINAVMTKLGKLSGVPDAELAKFLGAQERPVPDQTATDQMKSHADAGFIIKTLDEAGVALGNPEAIEALTTEAREYFWVEYRMGPSSPWTPVHPAFHGQNESLTGLTAQSTMQDTVPESLQHRFRFRAFIEQKTGDELEQYALMDAWERPVSNMAGKSLSYANMPRALNSPDSIKNIREVLATNNMFVPFYENSVAGPNTFDLAGRLIPLEAGMSNYAAVFETAAEKSTRATGSLATLGQADAEAGGGDTSPLILAAHWLEYTLIKPNGQETTYRRDLLDRIGKPAREAGNKLVAEKMDTPELNALLASFQSFMVAVGGYPDALIFDRSIERLINMRPALSLVMQGKTSEGVPADSSAVESDASYPFQLAQLAFYIHADQQPQQDNAIVNYRGEPSLVVQSKHLSGDDKRVSSFDIVTNKRRAFEQVAGQVNLAPVQAVLAGTWETRSETFLRPKRESRNQTVLNAVGVFDEAIAAGIPMRVLRPGSPAMLDNVAVGEATRHHIKRDLESGYVLILPERSPRQSSEYFAWWRIDPATGETLGVISNGLGGDIEEELMLQKPMMILSAALAVMGGVAGYAVCTEQAPREFSTSEVATCCLADMVVGGGVGFFAGAVVGAYVGSLLGFLLMDMGMGFGMLAGDIWDLVPTFCT
jgi:hypothetical protein